MIIKSHKIQYGETRERQVFCLIPHRLDSEHLVWLEWITITEQCVPSDFPNDVTWKTMLVERGAFAYPRKARVTS